MSMAMPALLLIGATVGLGGQAWAAASPDLGGTSQVVDYPDESGLLQMQGVKPKPKPHRVLPTVARSFEVKQAFSDMALWPAGCRAQAPNETAAEAQQELCAQQTSNKLPGVYSGLANMASHEAKMSGVAKRHFELTMARSLMTSDVVVQTTREFGKRLFDLVVKGGGEYDDLTEDDALVAAFAPKCSVNSSGFAGNDPKTIRDILTVNGNVREVWCLMACLGQNQGWLDNILSQADEAFFSDLFGPAAGDSAWETVKARRGLVEASKLMPSSERWTFGIPNYLYPSLQSWVDFSFSATLPPRAGGEVMWAGGRTFVGCAQTEKSTDTPDITPPLSEREIEAQCEGAAAPCRLHWEPGCKCYDIEPGTIYDNRTSLNGYRRCAGASGTTADGLQLARSLGFMGADMLAFRTVLMSFLLLSEDHSFIEVMLAAEPFMADVDSKLSMQWGLLLRDRNMYADFQRIWPKHYTLKTSWGPVFHGAGDFLP